MLVSAFERLRERHINPSTFHQLHADMSEADVIALLGEPLPRRYDVNGAPVPVELVAGRWTITRNIAPQWPNSFAVGGVR